MTIIIKLFAWLLIIAGVAGVVLPAVPGLPLIMLGILIYAYQTNFTVVTLNFVLIMGALTLIGTAFDYLSGIVGAKRTGASKAGIWGAFVGGIAGLFLIPGWGIIIGPLAGAIIGEILAGKTTIKAAKVGIGTFLGIVSGTLIKIVIALTMLGMFIRQLFQ